MSLRLISLLLVAVGTSLPERVTFFQAALRMTGWRVNRWEGAAFLAAYAAHPVVQLSPGARAALGLA